MGVEEQTELVVALVAPIGTDVAMICGELEKALDEYGFTTHTLRLSDYLPELAPSAAGLAALTKKRLDEFLYEAMDAGNALRQRWSPGDVLALRAIVDIAEIRKAKTKAMVGDSDEKWPLNLERHAFILRSLKTPDELATLRGIYGDRLIVIGAYSPESLRIEHLAQQIEDSRTKKDRTTWVYQPEDLIDRDTHEAQTGGQSVTKTFHRADFFMKAWDRIVAAKDIERILRVVFGDPYVTPTIDEFAQFMAAGSARRSAELGRQVGAAIVDECSVVALGANEVPRFGGGSCWDGESPDNREHAHARANGGVETNRAEQERIAQEMAGEISGHFDSALKTAGIKHHASRGKLRRALEKDLESRLLDGGLAAITEFGRAVHAEMDALLDAARRGVPVTGCTIYTTTFPCHNCARHIVGAGITRVVFVEPYAKSKAGDLHGDSIVIDEPSTSGAVSFEPFVGVAPRRYLSFFSAEAREELAHQPRKTKNHRVRDFVKSQAIPLFVDLEPVDLRLLLPAYRARELLAITRFKQLTEPSP